MEININSNFGNIGMGRDAFDAKAVGSGGEAKGADGIGANHGSKDAVVFTRAKSVSLPSSEPVADVSDAALRRDDELGKLVNAAFNLPPPAMPSFAG